MPWTKIHPKVSAVGIIGIISTLGGALLKAYGTHLTVAEMGTAATALMFLAGYLRPSATTQALEHSLEGIVAETAIPPPPPVPLPVPPKSHDMPPAPTQP